MIPVDNSKAFKPKENRTQSSHISVDHKEVAFKMAKQISVIPKIAFGVIGQDYKGYWVGSVEGANKIGDPCVTAIDGVGLSSDPRVLPITIAENPRTLINSYDYGGVGGLGQPGSALYGIYDPTKTTDWDLITKAQSNQKDPEPSVQNWS